MFEKHNMPLATKQVFLRRVFFSFILGWLFILLALGIGMWGYQRFENMTWLDAFLNASMILSGMGQIAPLTNTVAKLFAGIYALFSGLAFMVILGVVFAPFVHRLYHKFHLDRDQGVALITANVTTATSTTVVRPKETRTTTEYQESQLQ